MECIYYPQLSGEDHKIEIFDQEFRHIKALRLKSGDSVSLSSGTGLLATALINEINKKSCILEIMDVCEDYLPEQELGMALGILDNRDRFEFAVEKAVELGVSRIIPLICDFSQKRKVNTDRLRKKIIAAMKQCKRAYLPTVEEPMALEELIDVYSGDWDFILADINGGCINEIDKNSIILIGPEGGFSPNEFKLLYDIKNLKQLWLSNKRLRAETAAIAAVTMLSIEMGI